MKILLSSAACFDESPDIFAAFIAQEEHYLCPNFLSEAYQKELVSKASTNSYLIRTPPREIQTGFHSCGFLTTGMRELVVEWKFRVVDSCDYISREVVVQSTNNLDRYTSLCPVTPWSYQLAAVTSLYTVTKIQKYHKQLSLNFFLALCEGRFTAKDIEGMERSMLTALNWRINPPIPIVQSTYLITVALPTIVTKKQLILDLTRFLTEVVLSDYAFVHFKPSTIAVAAVFVAIDIVGYATTMNQTEERQFMCDVSRLTKVDIFSNDVFRCMDRMKKIYLQGEFSLAQFE